MPFMLEPETQSRSLTVTANILWLLHSSDTRDMFEQMLNECHLLTTCTVIRPILVSNTYSGLGCLFPKCLTKKKYIVIMRLLARTIIMQIISDLFYLYLTINYHNI